MCVDVFEAVTRIPLNYLLFRMVWWVVSVFELGNNCKAKMFRWNSSQNDITFNLQPNNMWFNRGILVLLLLDLTFRLVSQGMSKLFPAPFQHNFHSCRPNSFPNFSLRFLLWKHHSWTPRDPADLGSLGQNFLNTWYLNISKYGLVVSSYPKYETGRKLFSPPHLPGGEDSLEPPKTRFNSQLQTK